MTRVRTVDEYIAASPKEVQSKLRQLRAAIRKTAPKATESISYRMPYYSYKGRLTYFAIFKNHIGLYIPSPVVEEHRRELRKYVTAEATIRFPLDQELPLSLIKRLIKARAKKNEAKETQ